MPRRSRCILPGLPCHVTQRGVDRRETFSSDQDRSTYLRLLRENFEDAQASLLGWCLMSNHVHLIALPRREDSLAILLRRVHGRYAQYYNIHSGRTGHLWQNRFFACALGQDHLWTALAYVDRNPVRAGIVRQAADYRWSSAAAHLSGVDQSGLLDPGLVASAGPWGGLGRGTCYRGRGRHHQTAALYVCRTPVCEREFGQRDLTAIRSLLDPWTSEERAYVGSRIQ